MAVARKKPAEPSCPLWLATYGDMVTNVLVFFVLLLSMSEIKKDDKFIDFMQALQEAFGYQGGLNQLPTETKLDVKNMPLAQMLAVPIDPHQLSQSPDKGTRSKHHRVSMIRPAERYPQAGKVTFQLCELCSSPVIARVTMTRERAGISRLHRTTLPLDLLGIDPETVLAN